MRPIIPFRHPLASATVALAAAPAPATEADGRAVYEFHCYFCHGYRGDAATVAATVLVPPPRDFTTADPTALTVDRMRQAIRDGRPGTAMQSFADRLSDEQITAVVDYVRDAFMRGRPATARYHSEANGWLGDPHDSPAAPFVTGDTGLDVPWDALSPDRRTGRQIYLTTCVSCHSRDVPAEPLAWRPEAVSFPPGNYEEENEPPEFEMHEDPPHLVDPTPQVLLGAEIYQESCATCHAEDGTGRNWIGSFLDPPPPNLNQPTPLTPSEREALVGAVRDGIVGTAMPAWRHVLDKSQIDAVVAYIEAAFRRPAP